MPLSQAKLLEGKILAAKIQDEIKSALADYEKRKLDKPTLLALQVKEDPSSTWYINQQEKLAAKLGIAFTRLGPSDLPDQETLMNQLDHYRGAHKKVHGIFLAMPFPKDFDADEILLHLDEKKDVEGVHPASLGLIVLRRARLIPPTAYAALKLIESVGTDLRGKKAAIIGQSAIVGRPLQMLLGERRVTTIVCNTGTSQEDLKNAVGSSDMVIGCAGQPGLIKGAWIKQGAVVIDVGTTEVNGKLVGDIEFEEAAARASFITPVPGGVGPLTVTMLMQNLIHAYNWQRT